MKAKFDTKSLVAGFIAGTAVVLSIAAAAKGPGSVGRFQTALNDNGTVLMTDTTTGQVWSSDFINAATLRDLEFKQPKPR